MEMTEIKAMGKQFAGQAAKLNELIDQLIDLGANSDLIIHVELIAESMDVVAMTLSELDNPDDAKGVLSLSGKLTKESEKLNKIASRWINLKETGGQMVDVTAKTERLNQ